MVNYKYFFDTYAIIEMINGNTNYRKCLNEPIACSILNIGELYLHHLRAYDKHTAEFWNKKIVARLINIDNNVIIKAMESKLFHRKLKLSLPDCVGYIIAKENNLKFLTGDSKFEEMDNVEFVK